MSSRRLVVVTGSSSGLGRAIASTVGQAGYLVIGVSRSEVKAEDLALAPDQYRHLSFDLACTDEIGGLAKEISIIAKEADAEVYGLVNNAALGGDGILPTMHNRDVDRVLHINLTAPIILTKYISRQMLLNRSGRVVNISSIVAHTGYRGLSVYAASKAGLEGFTRSLARDLGRRNITVNAVAPGFLDTAMTASLGPENLDRIKRRSALARFATVDEVAHATEFLLSPGAAAITGTCITVDAGSTA